MRTSRISRDTSKILNSLAATRTQRTLRQTRSGANAAIRDGILNGVEAGAVARGGAAESGASRHSDWNSDSDFSSAPEESGSDGGEAAVSKKRKRGKDAPPAGRVKHESKETLTTKVTANGKPKKARKVPVKKKVGQDGSVKIEPPPNWEEIYALTREMRNENVAPVDTMGCASLADRQETPRNQRFQTLVALMLSSQTKDTVTSVAIKGMQDNMPGGFNLESVLAIEPTALNAFINKVGFHNLKTKYIKQAAELLRDKWNSDIPGTIEGLISLPGVGPKMAYLCMSAAWGRDEGIGVDVHVHRITNLWGWNKTQQPEQTRAALESWLPKERWHDINNLLVGFGQTICLPVGRKCGDCKLADRGLCPSAVVSKSAKVKKEKVTVKTEASNSETTSSEKLVVAKQIKIKTEDVENSIPDIEDMGREPRRRTPQTTKWRDG